MSVIKKGIVCTGLPHPLLCPEKNEGWGRLRAAFDQARDEIEACGADVMLIYSTLWPTVVGHQIQANPSPRWTHVDELFHDLGSIPYEFRIDADFAKTYRDNAERRGLHARTVNYHGFPIDTGSITALKLLNPENKLPAVIVSSNVYCDRAETLVLGKAAVDSLRAQGKTAVVVAVTSLSNRLFTDFIEPKDDHIHSAKDEEWNRKVLEFLGEGRLEDVAQLSRQIHKKIRVHKVVNFKPMWWLSGVMGQSNDFAGKVLAYEPVVGTGACVATLTPTPLGAGGKEFDEEDVEVFSGERGVLQGAVSAPASAPPKAVLPAPRSPAAGSQPIKTSAAPRPVGAYPHARRVGELLFVSGMGPRSPVDDSIPGGPIRDADGQAQDYDAAAQTRACIANISAVLEASGLCLANVVDVTSFLVDMDRDFAAYNGVYGEFFKDIQATRTTVAVSALPTPIAVELKVTARFPE